MENWTRWNRSGPANPIFLCAYLCVRELPGRGSHVKDLTISRGSRCSSPRCGEALYAVRVLARQPAFANIKLPAREWSERGRRDIDHRTRGARVSTGSERINTFGL